MSRARATALTLVNWKGVFFEHYRLDRHVTALEGANGAGKTTVMIAAYVVLLPDLTRLRFVNLGETGATGGDRGIYGRLGEPGPSYSALEIDTGDGERVLAAVYLERKDAPSLSLTPFLITGLGPHTSTDRLLLDVTGSHEQVSTVAEIERKAAEAGLGVEIFSSSKDYFARLFERGVNPLRLASDEDRNKWNEMLRTSMTGGISRSLTSDLRSFLFKQESGLYDTLTRMNKNLEACRRTRLEVSEARVLEQEISGVYAAGRAMFEAALEASRELAKESRQASEVADRQHRLELEAARELQTRLEEVTLRRDSSRPRIERAQRAEAAAAEHLARVESAAAAAERLAALERERAQKAPEAELALERKAAASAERERAKSDRAAAQQTALRAAAGLGNLEAGLEELHRQAHTHRDLRAQVARAHAEVEALIEGERAIPRGSNAPSLAEALAPLCARLSRGVCGAGGGALDDCAEADAQAWIHTWIPRLRDMKRELDRWRALRERDLELSEQRRAAHAAARAALETLIGAVPTDADLGALARQELARLGELELLARRRTELRKEAQRSSALAERQRALRAELSALEAPPMSCAADFLRYLSELEAALRQCESARRDHETAAAHAAAEAERCRIHLAALEARTDLYETLRRSAARLEKHGMALPEQRSELGALLRQSDEARHLLRARSSELLAESEQALAGAAECEAMGGGVDPELSRLAEICDGQLLAARYDELDLEEARRVEAELGPLLQAIVVDDPDRAALEVMQHGGDGRDVWLLRAGSPVPVPRTVRAGAALVPPPAGHGGSAPPRIVVDLGYGLRVTPLREAVSLGRAARQRRAATLRASAEAARQAAGELAARQREEESIRGELEVVREHWESWTAGDPAPAVARAREELESWLRAEGAARESARAQRLEAVRLEARLTALRVQLKDHHLLDAPELAAEAAQTSATLESAEHASAELARVADARQALAARIHDLDQPPPAGAEIEAYSRARPALDSRRDRLSSLEDALAHVAGLGAAAWTWADAERAVAERTELVPELRAQHQRAEAELARAHADLEKAEAAWEAATERAQQAAAELAAVEAHLARARTELDTHRVPDAGPEAIVAAREERARHSAALEALLGEQSQIEAEHALARERALEATKRVESRARALAAERERAAPALAQWDDLAAAARAAGVLEDTRAPRPSREGESRDAGPASDAAPSAQRWLEARAKCELLADRLQQAQGGAELAAAAKAVTAGAASAERGRRFLELWVDVRNWLSRRLPAPLADLGEPLLGLSRLASDLAELEQRLARQEGELRGTSGDVARSIEVQLRRASAQVRRLNRALEGVAFGSIHGIRVQMERVEKMERVLSALRDGTTQELLFQANLPIEAALDEIFRRHAGGRTGGQRLIDYREYLELFVQIQRRADQSWERVNPSQVSTGEAIGIGAALMMVILSEWEREDQLLRRERRNGSLRFLFLDEANRLSQDNLGVLFDLCQTLDLQLLIAAPEVARAEGNTTYRLVRRFTEDGREEVLVTGRRATLPEAPSEPTPAPAPAPLAEQATLFAE